MQKATLRILLAVLVLALGAGVYFFRFSPKARKAAHLARGERYFAAGEFDKARLEFANVIKADPAHPLAIERMGEIWLKQGVPSQAMPFLLRTRVLAPGNLANLQAIPAAYLNRGDLALARKEALELMKKSPSDAAAWMCLAEASVTRQDVADAEEKLKAIQPWSAPQHYAAGVYALRRRELKAAEGHFNEALKAEPAMYRVHLTMADLHVLKLERDKAGEWIKKASEAAPIRTREKFRYAEFQAQTGRAEEAKTGIKAILGQAPDFVPGWIILAQILSASGDYSGALAALENVFSRDPTNYEARMEQALIHLGKKDVASAVAVLEAVTKEYPKVPLARYRLARAYVASGRWQDAQAPLRLALTLNPRFVEAQMLMAELNLRAGQAQDVVDVLPDLLRQQPSLAQARMTLGDAYRLLKRFGDAETAYRQQAIAFPKDVTSRILLGVVLRAQSKAAEAKTVFEEALKLAPERLVIVGHLAELDSERGDYAAARARIAALKPEIAHSAGGRLIEARIALAEKQWPKAEELLLDLINLSPNLDAPYRLLMTLYLDTSRVEEGLIKLEEKLKKNPEDMGARLMMARLCDQLRRDDRARAEYERVLAKKPDSVVALNNLASLLALRMGDLARAQSLAEKARALHPENLAVADTLAMIRYRGGDFEGALTLLRECAAKFAEEGEVPAEVSYHLGLANAAMGNFSQARSAFEKAAQAKENFDGKAGIPIRLQILGEDIAGLSLAQLEALDNESPGDPMVKLCLGEALEREGKMAEAITAYESALKANPKFALAAARIARVHSLSAKDRDKAVEFAKRARSLAPSDARVSAIVGVAVAKAGDAAWAYSLLQEVVLRADASTLLDFAAVAYRLGKTREAQQALERALTKADADSMKSAIERNRRMLDLASRMAFQPAEVSDVEEILKSDPANLPARMAAAAVLQSKPDAKAAIELYEKILVENPAFPIAEARLAQLILESGDWNRAHELAVAARKLLVDDPLTALVLGETSFRRKEYSRAADFLTEANRARPLDPKRLLILGSAYFEARNKSAAEEVLKRAVAAGLQGGELAEAERMLKQIHP